MSNLKTFTSAVTAAVLVSGIGLAFAQSEDSPPAEPTSTAATQPAEQAPADMTAMPAADVNAQQPTDDPTRSQPPADPSAPLPAQDPAQSQAPQATQPAQDMSATPAYTPEPAPRADRN